jgi:PAS domain S-box-containing protein
MGKVIGKKDSKNSYNYILDTVPNSIIEVDENLIIALANREAHKIWPSMVEGKSFSYKVLFSMEKKPEDCIVENTFKSKKPQSAEINTKKGEIFEIKTNYIERKGSTRVVVHILDITERIKIKEELQKSEEKYRSLTENINVGIYRSIHGPEGKYIEVNPAMFKMFGYNSREEFLKILPVNLYQVKKDRARFSKKLLKQEFVRNEELNVKKKDGTQIICSTTAIAVRDQNGEVKYIDGIVEDITERKLTEQALKEAHEQLEKRVEERTAELKVANLELQQEILERKKAEEALRKSEANYRGLIENMLEGVYQTRPDGKIISANPALVQMLGYDSEEELCIAASAEDLYIDSKDRKVLTSKIEEKGELRNVELNLKKKNGQGITALENARVVRDQQSKVMFYEGVLTDISERKQTEEKIKAALEEKEVLLKEIHHRVKNNMQMISSLLKLQEIKMKDLTVRKAFRESQNRIRSMAMIHEKLYQSEDLAKIDIGKYIESLTTDLFWTYNVRPDTIKLRIRVKNVYLDIDLAIPCGLIINELVSNSLKYAFPEGEKGEIIIDFSLKNDKYQLTVGDNGTGFPEDLDFRKVESLGMQLVMLLGKKIKGTIELNRRKGTVFKIIFRGNGD